MKDMQSVNRILARELTPEETETIGGGQGCSQTCTLTGVGQTGCFPCQTDYQLDCTCYDWYT